MPDHPIQGLMRTALESLREMIDVNTVVGDPVETQEGQVIIPISRVSLGFAAGGAEYTAGPDGDQGFGKDLAQNGRSGFPFGGGSGAGVSVQPVGFLVVSNDDIRMLPVHGGSALERVVDLVPRVMDRLGQREGNQGNGQSGARGGGGEKGSGDGGAMEQMARVVAQAMGNGGSGGDDRAGGEDRGGNGGRDEGRGGRR